MVGPFAVLKDEILLEIAFQILLIYDYAYNLSNKKYLGFIHVS